MDWVQVLSLEELPEGTRRVVKVQDRSILLVHHKGAIYAVNSACPHMRGPLEKGQVTEDGAIICPWHHSAFDLRTGNVKEWSPWPPAIGRMLGAISREKALPTYPTRVDAGQVWVGIG